MNISERHRYAAASVLGMAVLGEITLLMEMSSLAVFYMTILGGVLGIYLYSYGVRD